jgi:hypothetical protein
VLEQRISRRVSKRVYANRTTRKRNSCTEETTIVKVTNERSGWSIERADGWSFYVPESSPVVPAVGMADERVMDRHIQVQRTFPVVE